MGGINDLTRSIGDGVSTFVGRAIEGISGALTTIVTAGQAALPGPWFPIAVIAGILLFGWLVLRR